MCCTRLTQKYRTQNSRKIRRLCTVVQLRNEGMYQQSEKNSLNSNISSTRPHNMVNFGPLTAEIVGWRVSGTPANFNGFRILASLPHRRRSVEVNQTLHDVWPSLGLVHYVYGILSVARFTLRPSLAFSYIGSVTARHSNSGRQPNFCCVVYTRNGITELLLLAIFNRGRHLYSEGDHHVWHWPTF